MNRKLISFDWAIKRLLRSKANFNILEGFLSELLFEDIKILEILESESNKTKKAEKYNRVDLKVKNSKDEIIIIELQYERELDYLQRILYGVSKVISEHLDKGEIYQRIVKVISINILYFDLGSGKDYIYKGTTSFKGLHFHDELKLSDRQIEKFGVEEVFKLYPEYYLIKVNNFDNIAKDSLDEWIYFLKNEEIKDNFQAKGLKEAKEELDVLKLSEKDRQEYESYKEDLHYQASMFDSSFGEGFVEGEKKGVEKGRVEGIEKGEKQKAIEIAKKSLLKGLDIEIVADLTGLSIEDIKKIKN